jgi:glyceraldehyde 3-phosphate dehydrogenase
MKLAINGFGRIGRLVLRILHEQHQQGSPLQVVAVNDLVPADNLAYLLKYDSSHGRFPGLVSSGKSSSSPDQHDFLLVDEQQIKVLSERGGPHSLPWAELGIDIVIEATGLFTSAEKTKGHLDAGASKVVITAPAKGEDITVVMGVNDKLLDPDLHRVVSCASCTTNCLAPMLHVLLEEGIGVEEGLMTTVHSYTASQMVVDGASSKDWKGGRAAAINIISSTTGAAKAVSLVLPALAGRLTGMAFRVPTANVSVVDLTVRTNRDTSLEEINTLIKRASQTYLAGILGYTEEQVVSSDFIHEPLSCVYDAGSSIQLNSRFFKLVGWYDNEWGYANRVVDLVRKLAGLNQ